MLGAKTAATRLAQPARQGRCRSHVVGHAVRRMRCQPANREAHDGEYWPGRAAGMNTDPALDLREAPCAVGVISSQRGDPPLLSLLSLATCRLNQTGRLGTARQPLYQCWLFAGRWARRGIGRLGTALGSFCFWPAARGR